MEQSAAVGGLRSLVRVRLDQLSLRPAWVPCERLWFSLMLRCSSWIVRISVLFRLSKWDTCTAAARLSKWVPIPEQQQHCISVATHAFRLNRPLGAVHAGHSVLPVQCVVPVAALAWARVEHSAPRMRCSCPGRPCAEWHTPWERLVRPQTGRTGPRRTRRRRREPTRRRQSSIDGWPGYPHTTAGGLQEQNKADMQMYAGGHGRVAGPQAGSAQISCDCIHRSL